MSRGPSRYYGSKLKRDLAQATGTRKELKRAYLDGRVEDVKKLTKRYSQLSMALYGGTTDADKGVPFDDEIPF